MEATGEYVLRLQERGLGWAPARASGSRVRTGRAGCTLHKDPMAPICSAHLLQCAITDLATESVWTPWVQGAETRAMELVAVATQGIRGRSHS